MAELTYNIRTGVLVARPQKSAGSMIMAHAMSGDSNFWWDSQRKMRGGHGSRDHVHGGPLPSGHWKLHVPGSRHPDQGRLRPNWIPVGPVGQGRTHIYIHPAGTLTEGCIAVRDSTKYKQIFDLVKAEGGGVIHVIGGSVF